MSWKSIVITGLLCVVASPVLAAPAVNAKLLGLNAAGNWIWQINAAPDAALFANNPPNGTGGSVAIEVGATASGRNLVSAAANATNFPANNPGSAPAGFAFWTGTDTGVEANVATNQLFAALGSTYFTTGGDKEALTVVTQRPTTAALTTTLTFSGAYTGNGRVAQAGQNFDTVTGANAKSVVPGNTNLDGNVNVVDLGKLSTNFNQPGTSFRWQDGDFSGDGKVDVVDLGALSTFFNTADTNWTTPGTVAPGGGSGSLAAAGVPEPASVLMLVMGALMMAFRSRK